MTTTVWINELADSFTATTRFGAGDIRFYQKREKSEAFSGVAMYVEYSQLRDVVKQLTADQLQELADLPLRDGFPISTSSEVLRAFGIDINRAESCSFARLGAIVGLVTEIRVRLNAMARM